MPETILPVPGEDVAKPGTTPAEPTGKPIIVGHTSQVASDPMMSDNSTKATVMARPVAPKDDVKAPDVAPIALASKPKLTPSAEAVAEQQAETASKEDSSDVSEVEAAEQKAREEREARLQEITESGEYRVSISQNAGKKSAGTFLLAALAVVLIGVIGLYILADLGVVDVGVKVPFHLFGHDKVATTTPVTDTVAAPTQRSVVLPHSKLNVPYMSNVWKLKTDTGVAHDGVYDGLENISTPNLFVSVGEFPYAASTPASCIATSTCTKGVTDFTSIKLANVKKQDLYLTSYISETDTPKAQLFHVILSVSQMQSIADLNNQSKRILTVTDGGKEFEISLSTLFSTPTGGASFSSLADAQAFLKNDNYKLVTGVLQNISD